MVLDLLNEFINDTSPFYFYFNLLWATVGALQLIHFNVHQFMKYRELHTKHSAKVQVEKFATDEPIVENLEIRKWLTNKFKRIEAPDDDTDSDSFSFFTKAIENRGGREWKNVLYSPFLKNIALSASC